MEKAVPPPKPSYREIINQFNWDRILDSCDWPVKRKYNLAHELCDRWAGNPQRANALALRFETVGGKRGSFSFAELKSISDRFAVVLAGQGLKKGDRVAGLLPQCPEVLPALLGVWKLGAVYVPLFTAFAPPAVHYRLNHSQASLVITDLANLSKVQAARQLENGLPFLREVILVDPPQNPGVKPFLDFWEALEQPEVKQKAQTFRVEETTPEDLLEIQYTSGTTGQPKGAMLSHALGLARLPYTLYALDLKPPAGTKSARFLSGENDSKVEEEPVFWGGANPGWAFGLITGLCCPLLVGRAATSIAAPFSAEQTWKTLANLGVTHFAHAPAVYRQLSANPPESGLAARLKLTVAVSAGEPLPTSSFEWFRRELGLTVYDQYGQTELPMIVNNYPALSDPLKPGSIGLPLPGFDVRVITGGGKEAAPNEIGQVALNREGFIYAFKGYWRDPARTEGVYLDRWHLSGDVARRDTEGYFWFEGRRDDLINSSGYRIGPFEVESALNTHPWVQESGVISVPDEKRGEIIKAFIVLKPGFDPFASLEEELKQTVRDQVGRHAYPRLFEFVKVLPKTPSGKLQRYLLRKSFL